MPCRRRSAWGALVLALSLSDATSALLDAQTSGAIVTDLTLYGDNTEFSNRFRDGDTVLGAAGAVGVDLAVNDRVTVRGGLFFNHRFGAEAFADQWRPVISLTLEGDRSRFIFGTLRTTPRDGVGPDLVGPHGLLPALQVETLAFTRPYEAGLQWQLDGPAVTQDAWVSWQRLNTAAHRERFDAGVRGRLPLGGWPIALAYQLHHVHEGGQLFDTGPVNDSLAAGPGLIVTPRIAFFESTTIEAYALWSKHVADRAVRDGTEHGHGVFVRAAAVKHGWRGHVIVWGACNWLKDEGDLNYGSRLQDGTVFRPTRHYGEVGVSKAFYDADGVVLEGAARVHRAEKDYDYSFRVLARIDLAFQAF